MGENRYEGSVTTADSAKVKPFDTSLTLIYIENNIVFMLTVTEAAKKLRLSEDRVRKLLQEGRIVGARKFGMMWVIPDKVVIDPPLQVEHRIKRRRK